MIVRRFLAKWLIVLLAGCCANCGATAEAQTNGAAIFDAAGERAVDLQLQGKFTEAIQEYELALKYMPYAKGSPNVETVLSNLAELYAGVGRHEEAEKLFDACLELRIKLYGLKHRKTIRTLNLIATVKSFQGKFPESRQRSEQVLEIQKEMFGPKSLEVAATLGFIASIDLAMERYDLAEPLMLQAYQLTAPHFSANAPELIDSLKGLGSLYLMLGQYEKTEQYMLRCLQIVRANVQRLEKQPGASDREASGIMYTLGNLYRDTGRYNEAEQYYRGCLAHMESANKRTPQLATLHTNLLVLYLLDFGNLYSVMGMPEKAESIWRQGLELSERQPGNSNRSRILYQTNLASLASEQGRYKQAETLFKQVIELSTAEYGPENVRTISVKEHLAEVYFQTDRLAEAEAIYRLALKVNEATYGADHPHVAAGLYSLGRCEVLRGNRAVALDYLQRSLVMRRAKQGPTHPKVINTLNLLGKLAMDDNRPQDAIAVLDEARKAVRTHVARVLPGLTQAEQLRFLLSEDRYGFTIAISAAAAQADKPGVADISAQWILNSKGLAQQALAQRTLELRESGDPRVATLVGKLQTLRKQLAAMNYEEGAASSDQRRDRMTELKQQERDLSGQLALVSTSSAGKQNSWVELTEVRKAMPKGAVLVDFVKIRLFNFHATGKGEPRGPAHYLAWIVPQAEGGKPRLVDLGDAEAIELAVAEAQKSIQPGKDEKQADERAREAMNKLSQLILRPLDPELAGSARWFICPDAALWLIPWAALLDRDGRYVVENHTVSYVVSGRDLLAREGKRAVSAPVIFADPDYDLAPAEVGAATQAVLRSKAAPALSMRGSLRPMQFSKVQRLPGTAVEAAAIKPWLKTFCGREPLSYTERWALEGVFMAVRQPQVLIVSTHGFFFPDQDIAPATDDSRPQPDAARNAKNAAIDNPLLRCGVLLAGCNRRGEMGAESQDGVLTGLEIVGADLRGTQLVVLSACQTALGDVHDGDGVAGLRQAFQLAGAESVMATLWMIADEETAQLMESFFQQLADGHPSAESLRQAQLALINARRATKGAANPYYWAPFTLTGR